MENVRIITAAIGTLLAWLVGGLDYLVQTLVIFIIIDYTSGIAAAWVMKELSSRKGLRGIIKKIYLLCLVVVAQQLDTVIGGNGFLRNAVLYTLIANETISILENCGRIGIPIPKVFYTVLEKLKTKEGGENTNADN